MSTEVQRVVVLQDASRDLSPSAIRRVLHGLSLKPGDELMLLGILHQVNNPSTLSFMAAGKMMGYKIKVDSSILGANNKVVQEEVAKKKEEYYNNAEIIEISQQCKKDKITFLIEVQVGPSVRTVALKATKSVRATWVVLDRHMKKDKKFFMDRLPCGISRMKQNDTIEELRGPKAIEGQVSYDEMIPENVKQELFTKKSSNPRKIRTNKQQGGESGGESSWDYSLKSTSLSKTSSSEQLTTTYSNLGNTESSSSGGFAEPNYASWHFHEEGNTTNTEQETEGEPSPPFMAEIQEISQKERHITSSPDEQQKQYGNRSNDGIGGPDEVFKNSYCSICENKRPKIGWKRDFTYAELHAATEGFSGKNFLSEGGFGSVFRGELDGVKIAVKQHNNASFQGEKEFKSEVHVLSKARHENVVMLLGSCSEGSHRLLVYEYVCNGSLDQHLSKHARDPLSWEKRMKIALETAKGLKYLHDNNIIHRDMRPNNILVTHDHESMANLKEYQLGDFGLARTQHEDSELSSDTRVVGTLGYLAPEYAECGKVSTKTDVYSFGVVLLQMITGLRTTDKKLEGKSLVGWARPLLKQRNYPSLIDERILDSHDVHQLFWMVRVAEKCLSKDPQKRLTMDKVVYALNNIRQGNTICHMSEFSPGPSDSVSSGMPDSSDSPVDDGSTGTDTTFTSRTSHHMSENLIPLPSTKTTFSRASTSSSSSADIEKLNLGGRNSRKKKKEKPKSRPKIGYDSMVE